MNPFAMILLLVLCGPAAASIVGVERIDVAFGRASVIVDVTIIEARGLQWQDPISLKVQLCGIVYSAKLNGVMKGDIQGPLTFAATRSMKVGSRQLLPLHRSKGGLRPYAGWEPQPSQELPFETCSSEMPDLKSSTPYYAEFIEDDLLALSDKLLPSPELPAVSVKVPEIEVNGTSHPLFGDHAARGAYPLIQELHGAYLVKWSDLKNWARTQEWYVDR